MVRSKVEDKARLDLEVAREKLSRAKLHRLLEATSGIWKEGDGLSYQVRIRDEWDRPA